MLAMESKSRKTEYISIGGSVISWGGLAVIRRTGSILFPVHKDWTSFLTQRSLDRQLSAVKVFWIGEQSLKNLRFAILALGPVVFCFASFVSQASATVFQASGTFDDGALLEGTLAIDMNAGVITASGLTISGGGTFTTILFQGNLGPPAFYSVLADNAAGTEEFSFGLLAESLVGFSGGSFCAADTGACITSVYYSLSDPLNQVSLLNGTLTEPSGATPEPSAFPLCAIALAGTVMLYQCRRSKRVLFIEKQ